MTISKRLIGLSMACGVVALVSAALPSEPASAGFLNNIFGGGKNNNSGPAAPSEPDQQSEPGPFFGRNGGLFGGGSRRDPSQPYSGAFHGDELPPEEGTEATRAWITNPELGTPTLSTSNIQPTKVAIAALRADRGARRLARFAVCRDEAWFDRSADRAAASPPRG